MLTERTTTSAGGLVITREILDEEGRVVAVSKRLTRPVFIGDLEERDLLAAKPTEG